MEINYSYEDTPPILSGAFSRTSPTNDLSTEKPTAEAVRAADYQRGVEAARSGTFDTSGLWLETLAFKRGYWKTKNE